MRRLACSLVVVLIAACSSKKDDNAPVKTVRVGAASDLQRAFTDIGAAFEKETGIKPIFDFGSSGLLAKQIEQSAPIYLYAAANRSFVDQVLASGKCDPATAALYSRGRLVLWSKHGAPAKLEDIVDPKHKRIGIANPDHAPYGKAAKEVLEKAGLYARVKDRLVLGENISATMTYAKEGSVDVAFVALSLAISTDTSKYTHVELDLHEPLEQTLVVCGKGAEADNARKLAAFITGERGREIMESYGFSTTGVMSRQ